jgi:asparagine synthase (glutamine-hydrolysing)
MCDVPLGCAERERGTTHRILRHGRPDIAALSLAAIRLGHRGPNGSGVHCVDAVGLAHTRLSMIDRGGRHQPILGIDGHYALDPASSIQAFSSQRAQ